MILLTSTLFSEEYSMLNAVYQILRGGVQSIDLATVTTPNETYYMFTALTWGMVADADIESESFRFLGGELRELLGAMKSILRKRVYHGRLSYLPINSATTTTVCIQNSIKQETSIKDQHSYEQDVKSYDQQENVSHQREESDINSRKGGLEDNSGDSKIQTTADISEDVAPTNTAPSSSILPSLADPIPNEWVTREDDFLTVVVGMPPLITSKFFIHPDAVLGSGNFNVVIMDNSISRGNLLRALMGMETGEYVNYPYVNIVQTRACRIEPMSETGRIVVDGEEVNYGPIQMEINKSINIFSRKKTAS